MYTLYSQSYRERMAIIDSSCTSDLLGLRLHCKAVIWAKVPEVQEYSILANGSELDSCSRLDHAGSLSCFSSWNAKARLEL